ncbi:MAG: PAS domain S-box protein [Smithella sp.]
MNDKIGIKNYSTEHIVNNIDSNNFYKIIFENSGIATVIFNEKNIILLANEEFEKLTGYSSEEVEGKKELKDFIFREDDLVRMKEYNRLRLINQQSAPRTYEFQLIDRKRLVKDIVTTVVNLPGIKNNLMTLLDITDRKKMEAALMESERRLADTIDFLPDATFAIDLSGKVIAWNRAMEEMTGVKTKDILGKHNHEYAIAFYGTTRPTLIDLVFGFNEEIEKKYYFVKREGGVLLAETEIYLCGKIRSLWGKAGPLYDCLGNVVGAIESVREITVLKQTEKALQAANEKLEGRVGERTAELLEANKALQKEIFERERTEAVLKDSEEKYDQFFKTSRDCVFIISNDGKIIDINYAAVELSGYSSREELLAVNFSNLYAQPEELAKHLSIMTECGYTKEFPVNMRRKDGSLRHTLITSAARYDADGNVIGAQGTIRDITDRKLAEELLRRSRRQLADIIEFLPDATLVIDKESRVIAWNRAMEAMSGVKKEDMIGKGDHEYALPFYGSRRKMLVDLVLNPDQDSEKDYTAIQRVGDVLLGDAYTPNLFGNTHLSGTASVFRDNNGEVIAAIECIRDNTERKKLEERLNRAEKMEALGTLAGGVAHDLNNVLGVLVGYTELMKSYLPGNSIALNYAENILQSGIRATAIIQDMLTMARRGVAVSEIVNLNVMIGKYLKTPEFENLKSHCPNVQISTELENNLFNIKGSPVHLAKTIMNLVSNAAESISDSGKISIRTENRYLDRPIHGYDTMQEGDYSVLIVSDTGSGISAKDIDKIFEPFYTKKVMGRSGTGLGLAVVWGTVKDHNGYIDVQSEVGKGTTFSLYFPITREESVKAEKTAPYIAFMGKGESILVVDDVKEQRYLATSILEKLGYRVNSVPGGEEAVEYLKKEKADLLVLDMIMAPGIDGFETYRRILDIHPRQKAIIVSGYSETELVKKAQKMGAGEFIRKPYIIEDIALAVRKELARKRL